MVAHAIREARKAAKRPRLYVRVNPLDSGLIEDDLDIVDPGAARRHHAAEDARRPGHHASVDEARRARGRERPAGRRDRHPADRDRERRRPLQDGELCGLEPAPFGADLGRRGPVRRCRLLAGSARRRQLHGPLSAGALARAFRGDSRRGGSRSTPSSRISATRRACETECEAAQRDGFTGQARHPSRPGRHDQCGLHAFRRGDRESAGDHRCLRGQSRCRRARHWTARWSIAPMSRRPSGCSRPRRPRSRAAAALSRPAAPW